MSKSEKRKAEGEPEAEDGKEREKKKKTVIKVCEGDATFEIGYRGTHYGVDIDVLRKVRASLVLWPSFALW